MARLDSTNRADLPNSAFAYVDSRGRRRLPINDEAHVRNALARFSQVRFEDERARERARKRLLNRRQEVRDRSGRFHHGSAALRARARADPGTSRRQLPDGFVTMLMTDVEGSTALVHRLGDRYAELIDDVRTILNDTAVRTHGDVVESRADDFFAVFERPQSAVETAIAVQRELRGRSWVDDLEVRIRIGIHSGYPTPTPGNYIGIPVHTAARASERRHTVVRSSSRARRARRRGIYRPTACASGASASSVCAACRNRCRCSRSQRRDLPSGSRRQQCRRPQSPMTDDA